MSRRALVALGGAAAYLAVGAVMPIAAQAVLTGHGGVEVRAFFSAPAADGQPRWASTSAVAQPELTLPFGSRGTLRAIMRARWDQSDPGRTYIDVREALLQWDLDEATLSVGVNTVFWGVTESRHLVDIVNQADYLDDLDGDGKFGQLMALGSYYSGSLGIVDLFVMTWARPQRYPGAGGRPGVPFPVLEGTPSYESEHDEWNVDLAVRWSMGVREVDWAVSYFRGTAREAQLLVRGSPEAPTLLPRYDLIDQGGLELQWTHGSWLWKAETIIRVGQGPTFAAVTGGFEHTTFGFLGTDVDLGALVEYSYDGRENFTYNIHDNDAFGGVRLTFNDVRGTEVLAGILQDVESNVTLGSIEASRRLGEGWRMELVGRLFRSGVDADPVYWFRRDDYAQVVLEYHY